MCHHLEKLTIPETRSECPTLDWELQTAESLGIRRKAALSNLEPNSTYFVRFSSIKEILTTRESRRVIERCPEGALVHIEYFRKVLAVSRQAVAQ